MNTYLVHGMGTRAMVCDSHHPWRRSIHHRWRHLGVQIPCPRIPGIEICLYLAPYIFPSRQVELAQTCCNEHLGRLQNGTHDLSLEKRPVDWTLRFREGDRDGQERT